MLDMLDSQRVQETIAFLLESCRFSLKPNLMRLPSNMTTQYPWAFGVGRRMMHCPSYFFSDCSSWGIVGVYVHWGDGGSEHLALTFISTWMIPFFRNMVVGC